MSTYNHESQEPSDLNMEYLAPALFPRGLGLIVGPNTPDGNKVLKYVHHNLLASVANGDGNNINIQKSLPAKASMFCMNEGEKSLSIHQFFDIYSKNNLDLYHVSVELNDLKPLEESSLNIIDHQKIMQKMLPYSHVGITNSMMFNKFSPEKKSEIKNVFEYLARLADNTEITISTTLTVQDSEPETWDKGLFWNSFLLEIARWTVHVTPTSESHIYCVHTIIDGSTNSKYYIKKTESGFTRGQ